MLEKTFPYISIEELSPVPLAVMMRMRVVKSKFLVELARHDALYDKCPMKIKRQIWAIDSTLFRKQVLPVVEPYVSNVHCLDSPANELWVLPLDGPRERRRASSTIASLLAFVDKSLSLYHSLLAICRSLYRDNGDPLLCALRADVLMALHDAGLTELY